MENATKPARLGLVVAVALMLLHQNAMAAQAPIDLGSASRFAVLAASEITSVPPSDIWGDVGLSPAARSKISGLPPAKVVGTIFAADDGGAVAVMLTDAQGDLTTAYNDAAGRTPVPTGPFLNPGSGNLGGLTLVAGLYKFTGEALLSGSDLTLTGSASDVWIFQIASSLTVANDIHVVLAGGAQAANIYWQVGTSATLGTTVIFMGSILALTSITLATGATVDGRVLAQNGAVTLDSNTVSVNNNLIVPVPNAAETLTLTGSISGIGKSLTKTGPGTLALTIVNSYTGGTIVTGGTLLVNSTTGSGSVLTSAGTTLGGTGTISPTGSNSVSIAPNSRCHCRPSCCASSIPRPSFRSGDSCLFRSTFGSSPRP